jgi:TolB-like protein/Flp pilus assembly protein TadD
LRVDVFDPQIAQDGGRIVKTMGDGVLVEFPSAVAAVENALAIQDVISQHEAEFPEDERIQFRVGINLGDVIIEGDDIHGDGVNVAARLEGLCEPGRVFISGTVYEHVEGKLAASFEDLGEQQVKNIKRPIRVYCARPADDATGVGQSQDVDEAVRSRQRPVVAVLPFDNISGDAEQEYFADGMTEDVITLLSKYRWLQVIARNTTFGYKGKSPDIRLLAKELGADYVVEGSVRRSEKRLRISAQLIDTTSGAHIWAERYDRDIADIFDLQDEITSKIVARAEPELGFAERHRVDHMPRTNLQAWDCYHLGMAHFFKFTAKDNLEAQRLFKRSFELDDKFGEAHAWWAYSVILGMVYWDTVPDETLRNEALEATQRALSLDNQNAVFYMISGRTALACGDYAASLVGTEEAINLNPTFAAAYCAIGDALAYQGRFEEAFPNFEKAIDLSPNDPQLWAFLTYGALACILNGDYERALSWTKRASILPNHQYWTTAHMAVALAYLGRDREAKTTVSQLLALKPEFSVEFARHKLFYLTRPEQVSLYLEGLRKAGFPEQPHAQDKTLPLPDKPSIAVLPFENMSGDPDQEYFADGISEDIITALSHIHQFFVVARNTTFTFKGEAVDVQAVARDLGVRYVLEGSVRKAGNRLRITAQLIDGETGNHIWAERYDREIEDIFTVQDEITQTVVGAILPELSQAEQERARRKPPENLDAWECYQRGIWHTYRRTRDDLEEAQALFKRATGFDPHMSAAYAGLVDTYFFQIVDGHAKDKDHAIQEAISAGRKAVDLDGRDALAHYALGRAYTIAGIDQEAIAQLKEAVGLNPNLARAEYALGFALVQSGQPEDGLPHLHTSIRLSPHEPTTGQFMVQISMAHLFLHQYEEALEWARESLRQPHIRRSRWMMLIASLGYLDRTEEAAEAIKEMHRSMPEVNLEFFEKFITVTHAPSREHLLDGLRKAGMTE